MYYDPMPIDLMVCVCEGHLGGTLVFVKDIRRGGTGLGGRGRAAEMCRFLVFREIREGGREKRRGGGREEGNEGMNKWREIGMPK